MQYFQNGTIFLFSLHQHLINKSHSTESELHLSASGGHTVSTQSGVISPACPPVEGVFAFGFHSTTLCI